MALIGIRFRHAPSFCFVCMERVLLWVITSIQTRERSSFMLFSYHGLRAWRNSLIPLLHHLIRTSLLTALFRFLYWQLQAICSHIFHLLWPVLPILLCHVSLFML